jgi:ABC-type Na+ efflux pump permease subunit
VRSGDAEVELHLNNINSDYSKNLRLRLDLAVKNLNASLTRPIAVVQENRWLATDPTMLGYISTSLLLFGCLYAGMVNTGLAVASEWNDRTIKSILMAPVSRSTLVLGKVIAGLGQSLVSIVLVLGVLGVGFHFRPVGSMWAMAAVMAMTTLMGAGMGAAFGVASKNTLATSSTLVAVAILCFLVCGNEESMRGLAWSQPMTSLWRLSCGLPPTYAFLAARSIFLTGDTTDLARNLTIVAASAAAVLALAAWLLRHAYSQLTGGNA